MTKGRTTYSVTTEAQRQTCLKHLSERKLGFWVTAHDKLRTVSQNDRLHPMLRPISEQLTWHGKKLSIESWKLLFLDALNAEQADYATSIDGRRIIPLGFRTSKLSVGDFNDLMTLIEVFAAEHGINISDRKAA